VAPVVRLDGRELGTGPGDDRSARAFERAVRAG
jgi:hypothetical protein